MRKARVLWETGWPRKAGSDPDLASHILQETEKGKGFPGLQDTGWQVMSSL